MARKDKYLPKDEGYVKYNSEEDPILGNYASKTWICYDDKFKRLLFVGDATIDAHKHNCNFTNPNSKKWTNRSVIGIRFGEPIKTYFKSLNSNG